MAPKSVISLSAVEAKPEWVFGYGSLMWNPGFPFTERHGATLEGYHRAFCVYSHHYRGTAEQPGLVLGLHLSGQCRGIAFRIAASDWDDVVNYLDERELIGYPYQPKQLPIALADGSTVSAYTYIADPAHPQFAGHLPSADSARLINAATGIAGTNRDYAINLIEQLETHGYPDEHLHGLLDQVRHHDASTLAID
jgi:glutathione-specific gamma-glutamylcyclotransferase